jgi:uncharacterized membrane protein
MSRGRLEAFSDGVLAIIITIMVLELGVPEGTTLEALAGLGPVFLAYLLSFLYVAIYWNNHHHLLKVAHSINASIMWANMGLLFCLSLFPFATAWAGENHLAPLPTFVYGLVLLSAAISYTILQAMIVRNEGGRDTLLAQALGRDVKGRLSIVGYVAALAAAFVVPVVSAVIYAAVALSWLIPDRRLATLSADADAVTEAGDA